MAVVTRYTLSAFDLEKAKSGALCAIIYKDIEATSGTISINATSDKCTNLVLGNGRPTTDYIGKGICRISGIGSLCITIGGIDYEFNAQGQGIGSSSIFYKLMMMTLATAVPRNGEGVSRSSSEGAGDSVNVTGLSARDEFASQALKGLMDRVPDPSVLSDSEIDYYCNTAYKWASLMMRTAASVRSQVDSTGSQYNVGSLDSNVEKLLNNIAVAISEGGFGGLGGDVSIQNVVNSGNTIPLTIGGTHTIIIDPNSSLGRDADHPLYVNLSGDGTPGPGGVSLNTALSAINATNLGAATTSGTAIIWNGSTYVWGHPTNDGRYYTESEVDSFLNSKVDKVIGKGLSTNDFTTELKNKLLGIEDNANNYVHPTGGANTTISAANGRVLSAITVNNLGHVTSVNYKALTSNDIPELGISKITGLQDALNSKLDIAFFSSLFKAYAGTTEVTPNNSTSTVDNIKAMFGFWTEQYISALGQNAGGISGGGGTGDVLWSELADSTNTNQIALSHLTDAITTLTSGSTDASTQNYSVYTYNNRLFVNVPWTDTKNTAGSTNTTDKLYLIGAKSQAANPQTYSNSSCYASGGYLYSGGAKVLTSIGNGTITNAMLAGSIANDKLVNSSVTINGTSVNLGGSITTSKWGTARNIYISDSDGSNTGTAVSVNGSANATLKLPSTIKATLNGTATAATKLTTTSKTAWGQTYWTSGGVPTNISGAIQNTGSITPSASGTYNIGTRSNYYNQINGQLLCLIDSITNEDFNIRWWPASREVTDKAYVALYAYETKMSDLCFGSTNPTYGLYFDSEHNKWGIGTNTPSQQLHVVGNIMASGAVSALGTSSTGTVGGSLATLSDVYFASQPTTGYVLTYDGERWIPQEVQNMEAYSLSKKNTTAIPLNSNLSNYTTPGNFTTTGGNQGSTIADSLSNKPEFGGGFRMYVTAADPTSQYIHQRIITYSGKIFDRFSSVSGGAITWPNNWREVAYTDSVIEKATRLADSTTKTAWGQNYWVNGQPASITGPMTGVTSIDNLMYFNSSKVGIGTNSPAYKLDISGSVGISGGDLNITRTGAITGVFTENTSGGYDIKYQATGRDYRLWFGIGSGDINRGIYGYDIDSNTRSISNGQWYLYFINDANKTNGRTVLNYGNVGIGTTAPSQKLHVVGNIMATGAVSALGMSATGTTGGSLATLADVLITSQPSTGYVLTFNGSKWVPQATQQQSLSGYLPLSAGTGSKIYGNVYFRDTGLSIYMKDSAGIDYPALRDNGSNLWIGASQSNQYHHKGATYISSGWTTVNGINVANSSIFVSVPESFNTSGNNTYHNYAVWHGGNVNPMRMVSMAANDDYDTLSGYTTSRGSFVATNWTTSSNGYDSITLDDKGLYTTLVSFGYSNRTIQLKGAGWDDTLKYRHVYTKPGTGSGGVAAEYVFSPWQTFAFTSDLANYLPLTGGYLSGDIYVRRSTSAASIVGVANSNGAVELLTYYYRGVYDRTGGHWIIMSDGTNNYLPSGNVGIGYGGGTTLSYKLDVNGSAHFSGDSSGYGIVLDNDKAISLKDSGGDVRRALFLNTNNQLAIGYGTTKGGVATDKYDTAIFGRFISFGTGGGNNTDPTIRMTIDKYGKVGIGAAPTQNELLNVAGKLRIGSGVIEWDATNQMLKFSGGNGIYAVGAVSALGITGDLNGQITRPLTFNSDITLGSYTQSSTQYSYKVIFGSSSYFIQKEGNALIVNGNTVLNDDLTVRGAITGTTEFSDDILLTRGKKIYISGAGTGGVTNNYYLTRPSSGDYANYIYVQGSTRFNNPVSMGSSLSVYSSITGSSLNVTNGVTAASFTISDNQQVHPVIKKMSRQLFSSSATPTIEYKANEGGIHHFTKWANSSNDSAMADIYSSGLRLGSEDTIYYGRLYSKADNKLYWKGNDNVEREIKFV